MQLSIYEMSSVCLSSSHACSLAEGFCGVRNESDCYRQPAHVNLLYRVSIQTPQNDLQSLRYSHMPLKWGYDHVALLCYCSLHNMNDCMLLLNMTDDQSRCLLLLHRFQICSHMTRAMMPTSSVQPQMQCIQIRH